MTQLKAPTTYEEQLEILQKRHVVIEDVAACVAVLESVNYYRLIAYFLPFKQSDGTYGEGVRFRQAYRIYEFDRKLRGILLAALEEVEIYLRARFAYYHAHTYGAEGYLETQNFSSRHRAEKFRENLAREVSNNRRSAFVQHHRERYEGHFPIWVIVELFSFGMLSQFYGDMKTADQKVLSRALYQTIPKNVVSWLRCCTDLRNICAHYGRLYFRKFPATPACVPVGDGEISRLWGAVLALRALYPAPDKWNREVLTQLTALLEEYEEDIVWEHIGFPPDWKQRLKI